VVENKEFSHGYHYGDYSGVVFYGPPLEYLWIDRLAVSDCYIEPLFRGVLDREWQNSGGEQIPRLVKEWLTLTGWCAGGQVLVTPKEAVEFTTALGQLNSSDVSDHCHGCTVEDCLRCAVVIREFIEKRLARGIDIFIEND
jgi:hypothetical protein